MSESSKQSEEQTTPFSLPETSPQSQTVTLGIYKPNVGYVYLKRSVDGEEFRQIRSILSGWDMTAPVTLSLSLTGTSIDGSLESSIDLEMVAKPLKIRATLDST